MVFKRKSQTRLKHIVQWGFPKYHTNVNTNKVHHPLEVILNNEGDKVVGNKWIVLGLSCVSVYVNILSFSCLAMLVQDIF